MNSAQLDALLRLPVTDRIRLVEVIWNSILESSEDPEVTHEDEIEVGGRAERLEADSGESDSR